MNTLCADGKYIVSKGALIIKNEKRKNCWNYFIGQSRMNWIWCS